MANVRRRWLENVDKGAPHRSVAAPVSVSPEARLRGLSTLFIVGEILLVGGGFALDPASGTASVRGPATLTLVAGLLGAIAVLLATLGAPSFGARLAMRA